MPPLRISPSLHKKKRGPSHLHLRLVDINNLPAPRSSSSSLHSFYFILNKNHTRGYHNRRLTTQRDHRPRLRPFHLPCLPHCLGDRRHGRTNSHITSCNSHCFPVRLRNRVEMGECGILKNLVVFVDQGEAEGADDECYAYCGEPEDYEDAVAVAEAGTVLWHCF